MRHSITTAVLLRLFYRHARAAQNKARPGVPSIRSVSVLVWLLFSFVAAQAHEGKYLDAAIEAGRWLESVAISDGEQHTWPVIPAEGPQAEWHLYSGVSGVTLFYLGLAQATADEHWLELARQGAEQLLNGLEVGEWGDTAGFYTGPAGPGYVLYEMYRETDEPRFLAGAERVLDMILAGAKQTEAGVDWNGVSDVVSGNAGNGLFLLYAAREMNSDRALEVAIQSGQHLLAIAEPQAPGVRWRMNDSFPRIMPNFSHGTAGVAYYLATLYLVTQRGEFLDGATQGAAHIDAIADKSGLVMHHTPDGEDLFYLGWCHGPAGTGRLYFRLWQITGNRAWLNKLDRAANSLLGSGIPHQQTPGFWNNVGICCGSAGVAQYFLSLHQHFPNSLHQEFVSTLTTDLIARGSVDQGGMHWLHSEHRVQPDLLFAQTGYMQGAAGIGLWLLELDAVVNEKPFSLRLPDRPF